MKTRAEPTASALPANPLSDIFALLFGLLLGLALVKFGNPIVMEKYVTAPASYYEWLFEAWPVSVSYWLLAGVAVLGLPTVRGRKDLPWWVVILPALWLAWQFAAAPQSIDPALTRGALGHFISCVACFYLGVFALGQRRDLGVFWLGLLAGFGIVLISGFEQHFGGLAQTRRYFFMYIYPTMKEVPPGLVKKMTSNRIFATLFYPNTLAGVILLLLPMATGVFWSLHKVFTIAARRFLMALAGIAALACLYWSGSKGGWLLMLLTGFVAALFLPFQRQWKIGLVTIVLFFGLAGFFWKYSGFFRHGATSVVARFDYWRAAVQTVRERPLLGTGPGTFGPAYARIKKPESEMAKVTHNDYLEQASDSGLPGFVLFTGFVLGGLIVAYRRAGLREDWVRLGVWLGLLAWALQALVEFNLYIPAVAWPALTLLGWLLAQTPESGSPQPKCQ